MGIDFQQGGDRVALPNDVILRLTEGGPFTLFCWGGPFADGGSNEMMVGQQNTGGKEMYHRSSGTNIHSGTWSSDQRVEYVTSAGEQAKNTLYVGSHNGASAMSMYVDGVFKSTNGAAGNGARAVENAWAVGAEAGGGRDFNGVIADARVYGRGLTAAEIAAAWTMRGRDNIRRGLIWRLTLRGVPGVAAAARNSIGPISAVGTPTGGPLHVETILSRRRRSA
jgi:hypothetical protein